MTPQHLSRPARALLALLLLCPALSATLPPEDAPARIPDVHTTSFSGVPVDLPSMLSGGRLAVLVLGFSKDSRTQATLWGRRLAADYLNAPDVLYFEMPVLESVPRLLRGVVLRSIKSDVSARAQPHFAAVLTEEQRWRSLAHYNRPEDAYVLLVDSSGVIRSQLQGEPTDAAYAGLKRQIQQLRTPPSN